MPVSGSTSIALRLLETSILLLTVLIIGIRPFFEFPEHDVGPSGNTVVNDVKQGFQMFEGGEVPSEVNLALAATIFLGFSAILSSLEAIMSRGLLTVLSIPFLFLSIASLCLIAIVVSIRGRFGQIDDKAETGE